jgi:hypothetical protein
VRHEDLSLLEDLVRIANPVPHADALKDSEAASRVLLLVKEQTDAAWSPAATPDHAPSPRRGWLRPALVVAIAFVVALSAVGIVTVLRHDPAGVVEQPDPVTTTGAPEIIEDAATFEVAPFADIESALSRAWPLNQVADLAFAPDGSLWAATAGGVVNWEIDSETPTMFTTADGLPALSAQGIDVAADGTVWVTAGDWVARYDGSWTSFADFGSIEEVAIQLGMVVASPGGGAWFWADMTSGAGLLHFDGGEWTAFAAPEEWAVVDDLWAAMAFSLDIDPDETLWVGTDNGVLAFDGAAWRHHTPAHSGLPSLVSPSVAAAPDGTIWVGTVAFEGDEVRAVIEPAGVAAFDGSTWTTYRVANGLPNDAAGVAVGDDGTVWALADEGVSRFDGDDWTRFAPVGQSRGTAVGPEGSLWQPASPGIAGFDGEARTSLVVSPDAAPGAIPDLTLSPVGEPVTTATPVGDITWYRFAEPPGIGLHEIRSTPHGLVALDGNALRWSEDLVNWRGTPLPMEPWRLTTDGGRVIVHRDGALWLRWDGDGWVADEFLELNGNLVEQIVVGEPGTVVTAGLDVFHAPDGRIFRLVENAPHPARLMEDWAEQEDLVGCSYISGGTWPGPGDIGPVLPTNVGLIALTPAHPANWNNEPLCEPVLWASGDGLSWELLSAESPFGEGAVVNGAASHDDRHIAVGAIRGEAAIWLSDDGREWTLVDLPANWYRADLPEELTLPSAVAGSNEGWLILEEMGAGWVSRDGSSWTQVPNGMPDTRTFWSPQNISMGHGLIAISGINEELVFGVIEQ